MRYTSSLRFLRAPLVDINVFEPNAGRSVVRGWIAIGDIAIGNLLAVGGVAIGTVAVGGVTCGVLSIGGLAIGVACLGGAALGALWALGGLAAALHAAVGGLAIALSYAQGGYAVAAHANDSVALQYLGSQPFFIAGRILAAHSQWALLLLLLPLFLLVRRMRKGASLP